MDKKEYLDLLANYGAFVKLVEDSYYKINKLANKNDMPISLVVELVDATDDLKKALNKSREMIHVH